MFYLYSREVGTKYDFPGGSDGKEAACNTRDPGSIPGSGRSLGEGNGNLLKYSCLENSMDRGAWQPIVYGIAESDMTERLMLSLSQQFSPELSNIVFFLFVGHLWTFI